MTATPTSRSLGARIFGFLFLFLFGGVFACVGLIAVATGIGLNRSESDTEGAWVAIVVGSVFLMVGLGVMAAGVVSLKQSRARDELETAHPSEPWHWRRDWHEGEITSNGIGGIVFLGFFALIWNVISWGMTPIILDEFQKGNKPALIGLLFPLVGVLVLMILFTLLLRSRRFGRCVLHLKTKPAVIGGTLEGVVVCPRLLRLEEGLQSKLSCQNIVTTGSGKNSSTRRHLIFETRRKITSEEFEASSAGTEIPVSHVIPYGLPESDESNSRNRFRWLLELRAEIDGPDFVQEFTIPAFVTEESSPEVREMADLEIDVERAHASGRLFENSDIGFQKLDDGAMEIYFPSARNKGAIVGFFIFSLIWGGAIYGILHTDAPLIFPIFFGLFELFFIAIVLNLLFSSSLVHVRPDGIGYEKRMMGFLKRGFHPPSEIEELEAKVGMQSGNQVFYRFQLKLRNGKSVTLGSGLPDKAEALALIAASKRVLGL